MTDEKTLLEEILDVRKKIKNGLLDSDDTISNLENEGLREKRNVSQSNLNNSRKIIKLEKTRNEKIKRETIEKEAKNREVKKDKKQKKTNLTFINSSCYNMLNKLLVKNNKI